MSHASASASATATAELCILRVFADAHGRHGNPLGVLGPMPGVTAADMLALTRRLGFSETVLLGADGVPLRIFNPVEELPFAGHPMVGAAWLLADRDVTRLTCAAGACEIVTDDELTWVTARAAWAPPWRSVQYDAPADIEALAGPPRRHDFVQAWAWTDEAAGRVRARVFAPRVGIPEDEACGSASLLLADRLGRELVIDHGRGSVVHARPVSAGIAQVGGRVVLDERRPYT